MSAELAQDSLRAPGTALPDGDRAPASPPDQDHARSRRVALIQIVAILVGAAGFAWVLRLLTGTDQAHSNWVLMVLLAGASLAAGCWGAYARFRDYIVPLRQLLQLLPLVRDGQRPIEELSTINRGLAPLIPQIQQLVRDLRQQKLQNAELQDEIRQRVLTRTDALERKIGSLTQQATRDALTGLNNRRQLDQQLPAQIEQCKLQYTDLSVLMIDVDYFKVLNDTLGHAAGDELLRQIAQLMRSSIRATDTAYRCGGDEFVVVLPGASIDIATRLAERMRSLVDSLGKTLKVTRPPRLSIGIATLHQNNVFDAAELLAQADRALYDVKAARPVPSR